MGRAKALPLWLLASCGIPGEGAEIFDPSATGSTGAASTTGPVSTSSSGAEASSAASTEDPAEGTTAAPPLCGDGHVDPDEACDDGNMIDGDGCNSDCVPSGELVKETVFDPDPAGDEALLDIDHASDGSYVVAGYVYGSSADLWAAGFDDEDAVLWAAELAENQSIDVGWGVSANDDGSSYIVGVTNTDGGSIGDPYIAHVSSAGRVLTAANASVGQLARWLGARGVDDGVVAVGQQNEGANARGLVRHYSEQLVQEGEIEPVPAAPGLSYRRVCATEAQLLVVGSQYGADDRWESIELLADAASTAWLAIAPAAAPGDAFAVACAVEGAGRDRRLWTAGYATSEQRRWVPWLRRRTVDGALGAEIDDYTGELDLGAWYGDADLDPEGNLVVVGADLIGEADPDWRPLVRKFAPDGTVLWSRVFEPGGFSRGTLDGVSTGPNGEIRVVGYATESDWLRRRYFARFTP